MRWNLPAALLLAVAFVACSDAGSPEDETPDATGADAAADDAADAGFVEDGDHRGDASSGGDAGDADATPASDAGRHDTGDAATTPDVPDASADADASSGGDAGGAGDAGDVGDPNACACDVTAVCDDGCACDIACSIEIGPLPAGGDSVGSERNEIAVLLSTAGGGVLDEAVVYDDDAEGGFAPMLSGATTLTTDVSTKSLSADIDEDGRDETIVVTATDVHVLDGDDTELSSRVVYAYPAGDWFDAAAGDLDHDGGRALVLTRQVGSVVTIEVLDIPTSGEATVRTSAEVSGVLRHAVDVAALTPGEAPRVHLLTTQPVRDYAEPAEMVQLRLDGDALHEERRFAFRRFCGFGFGAVMTDDGISLAVGELNDWPGIEYAVAAYCSSAGEPSLTLSVHNADGEARYGGNPGAGALSGRYTAAGRVRPLLALGRFYAVPDGEGVSRPWTPVVGWTEDRAGTQTAVVGSHDVVYAHTGALNDEGWPVQSGSMISGLAVRDLNRDGIDEIVTAATEFDPFSGSFGGSVVKVHDGGAGRVVHSNLGFSTTSDTLPGAVIAVGDVDQDSIRIRHTGTVYRHLGDPVINNIVAAPPTWLRDDVTHAGGSETTFGVAGSAGESHGGMLTYGATVGIGLGISIYKLLELYGSATASFGVTHSWTHGGTTTFGRAITAGESADLVSYSQAMFASYEYEIVAHPDDELIGERLYFDVPARVIESTTSVAQFRASYPELAERVIPPGLLRHTVGDPRTYETTATCSYEGLTGRINRGEISAVYASTELTDVGNAPSGSRSISLDVETFYEVGHDVETEVDVTGGFTFFLGITGTARVGSGYSFRRTVSRSGSYEGSVSVISEGYGPDTRYEWGLCLFHWADAADGPTASYPVTTYVVRPY